ncbi:MAG: DUF1638 domain-containing protein [Lentisphaeria bacterium]|nr:DUF1638 domain-containing protein [Lentisphaeria bacterium]
MDCQRVEPGFVRRPEGTRRFALLACEVLYREVTFLLPLSRHAIDVIWLSQGLHDLGGARMAAELQRVVDGLPPGRYDAVLLAFALCNNGVVGLRRGDAPLVIPKAHDCIALFLGSRQRYREYFDANPGTYYLTTGWMERDDSKPEGRVEETPQHRMGLDRSWEDMVAQYGEDNARYLRETLGNLTSHYNRLVYISQPYDRLLGFEAEARKAAAEKGWEFETVAGDLFLLARLLNGEWDGDFVVAAPGECLAACYDEEILRACPCPGACRGERPQSPP